MKRRLLLFASALFVFGACEKIATPTTNVDANLTQEVNVDSKADGLKTAGFVFSVVDTLDFADNQDLEKHLSNIEEMVVNETTLTISGMTEGTSANITISLPQANIVKTYDNIVNGSEIKLDADLAAKLNSAAPAIVDAKKIFITVSGSTTDATTFKVLFDFYVTVKAGL